MRKSGHKNVARGKQTTRLWRSTDEFQEKKGSQKGKDNLRYYLEGGSQS